MCSLPAGCEPSCEREIKLAQLLRHNRTAGFFPYYFIFLHFCFSSLTPSRSLEGLVKFFLSPPRRESVQNGGKEALNANSLSQRRGRGACCFPQPVEHPCSGPTALPPAPQPLAEPWVPAGSVNVSMARGSRSWFFSPLVYLIETSNRTCLVTEQKSVSVYPPNR